MLRLTKIQSRTWRQAAAKRRAPAKKTWWRWRTKRGWSSWCCGGPTHRPRRPTVERCSQTLYTHTPFMRTRAAAFSNSQSLPINTADPSRPFSCRVRSSSHSAAGSKYDAAEVSTNTEKRQRPEHSNARTWNLPDSEMRSHKNLHQGGRKPKFLLIKKQNALQYYFF